MHPVLFKIGPVAIYSYGLMLALGFLTGIYLAKQEAVRLGIGKEIIYDLGLYTLISGILGARILYVLVNLESYTSSPLKILLLNEGGLVFYGGLILACIVGFLFIRKKRLSFFRVADIVAPSIAVGESIGRIGCLLYGCCYGHPTSLPWGISFEPDSPAWSQYGSMYLHPTQIYSSLSNLAIFIILTLRRRNSRFEGEIILFYLMLSSLGRFMIENLRGDNPEFFLTLTISQCLALLIGITAGIVYLLKKRRV